MSGVRKVAIHRALVRPELVLGCDRRLLYFLGTQAFTLGGAAGFARRNWAMALLGVVVFVAGVYGLQQLAKMDPQWWGTREAARHYKRRYVARARPQAKRRGVR